MKRLLVFLFSLWILIGSTSAVYAKDEVLDTYRNYVHDRLKENWHCKMPFHGPVLGVNVTIASNGEVQFVQVYRSAGSFADSEAIRIIESLNPFKPFPPELNKKEADFDFLFSQFEMY